MTKTLHKVKNKILISTFFDRYYTDSHNLVIPATCDTAEDKWKVQRQTDYNGVTLIYAGSPGKKDNLHQAIIAVQRLLNDGACLRFLILGTTRESYLSHFASLLECKDLHPNIHFIGRVPQDEVPQYYAKSDFMVLLRPSNRKSNAGFPTKFAESMASGTPVIANYTSDISQYLESGYNGVVVETPSSNCLYDTLKSEVLALSKEQIERMKTNAKVTGVKCFDFRSYTETMDVFLNNLIL